MYYFGIDHRYSVFVGVYFTNNMVMSLFKKGNNFVVFETTAIIVPNCPLLLI